MRIATALPHLAWALVAVGTYLVGSTQNSTSPTASTDAMYGRPQAGRSGSSTSEGFDQTSNSVLSALPSRGATRRTLVGDPEAMADQTMEVLDAIDDADDPLAVAEALDPKVRREVARGVLLVMIDDAFGDNYGTLSLDLAAKANLFGVPDQSLDRMLMFAVAKDQLSSSDPAARMAATDWLDLSDEEVALVEQSAAEMVNNHAKRNAQNLASVHAAAVAAGADLSGLAGSEQLARKIVDGVFGGVAEGFDTTLFKVQSLDEEKLREALAYLDADLNYVAP